MSAARSARFAFLMAVCAGPPRAAFCTATMKASWAVCIVASAGTGVAKIATFARIAARAVLAITMICASEASSRYLIAGLTIMELFLHLMLIVRDKLELEPHGLSSSFACLA